MKETYLGVHVSPLTYEGIINEIKPRMTAGQQSTIIAVNPEKVMAAQKNPEVKQLINGSTFQIPDGVGILLASKMKNGKIHSRVTGVDMMARLLKFAADENHPIYLYGAKNEVVQKAAENIKQQNPGITIAGITDGYEQDEAALILRINESGAEIIFVALGSPKQELWIKRNMDNLKNVLVFQGVGGSFDVFSGTVKRAPALFRNTGTEWLYRLASDPKRIKRQMNLPLFLMNILFNRRN
ncbi:WecB/TagA/CpsF family glycosyltransferase [Sporosarcina thermotolerans]|uniref:N-acetylglucosaminyldiphosphoundecaprenol N-acetyl-beta-D-mannosaminyltransferase n=1 Tax=Sporosarcina thermotolerans TaxID=633404 RepID=A0AAW9A7Y4_9BACL|nr:WecB/TagA/CpsF family glycosyltransferase [Sporosarcina thermotolerans]MDW0116329.1 WecB/TagA/CpsF family glycosyltransferase [Sporosarcina thermotolerans]WHT48297.1 WecB/TagA/CpsF family glycosyltransferase [Sporosarcina thermotolerans]